MAIGNQRLLQEPQDIPSLMSESGGDVLQACPADGAVCRLDTMADLALDDGRTQRSLCSVVGGFDSLSRGTDHNASTSFRSFWKVRTALTHGIR